MLAPGRRPWLLAALGASCLLLSLYVAVAPSAPAASLGRWNTDHYSHYGAAILFWHRGLDLYRRPARDLCRPVPEPPAAAGQPRLAALCDLPERAGRRPFRLNWQELPRPYPPGVLVYSVPEALLFAHTGISFHALNRVTIIKHTIVAHLLVGVALLLLLRRRPGEDEVPPPFRVAAFALVPIVYLAAVPFAVGGVYDAIAVLCVFLALTRRDRGDPLGALLLLGLGLFLHFRTAWYLPLAVVCLVDAGRAAQRSALRRPAGLAKAAAAVVLFGLAVGVFRLVSPFLASFPHSNFVRFAADGTGLARALDLGAPLALALGVLAWERQWRQVIVILWLVLVLLISVQVQPWHAMFLLPLFGLARVEGASGRALAATVFAYLVVGVAFFRSLPLPGTFLSALLNLEI